MRKDGRKAYQCLEWIETWLRNQWELRDDGHGRHERHAVPVGGMVAWEAWEGGSAGGLGPWAMVRTVDMEMFTIAFHAVH